MGRFIAHLSISLIFHLCKSKKYAYIDLIGTKILGLSYFPKMSAFLPSSIFFQNIYMQWIIEEVWRVYVYEGQ